ncbi:hypothetical protein OF83DRAFT_1174417 [Amylostereum chailletii]|nr:hypothetical protein OF83DRAFT_1174417 [Amylostereum chailletii]
MHDVIVHLLDHAFPLSTRDAESLLSTPIFEELFENNYFEARRGNNGTVNLDFDIPYAEFTQLLAYYKQDANGAPHEHSHTAGALALALALAPSSDKLDLSTLEMVMLQAIEQGLSATNFATIYTKAYERRSRQLLTRLARASFALNLPAIAHAIPVGPYNLLERFRYRAVVAFPLYFVESFPLKDGIISASLRQAGHAQGSACTCSIERLPGSREHRKVKVWLKAYVEHTLPHLATAFLNAPRTQGAFVVAQQWACPHCIETRFETCASTRLIRPKEGSDFQFFVALYHDTLKEFAAIEWENVVSTMQRAQ